ncbi:hypothetical protein SK128_000238 [Halocaridina rubra]|uniref:Uncharacterized protein n=1 Tax=Halocaridina rubra TaxID=373956 RepID=A0AAN8XFY8_HALRR
MKRYRFRCGVKHDFGHEICRAIFVVRSNPIRYEARPFPSCEWGRFGHRKFSPLSRYLYDMKQGCFDPVVRAVLKPLECAIRCAGSVKTQPREEGKTTKHGGDPNFRSMSRLISGKTSSRKAMVQNLFYCPTAVERQ